MMRIILIFLVAALFLSCNPSRIIALRLNEVVLNKGLYDKALRENGKVDICSLIDIEWDKIWIIRAYVTNDQLRQIKAKGFSSIKGKIKNTSHAANSESGVQLVIERSNEVVGYGELSTVPLNLSLLYHEDGTFFTFTKEDCSKFIGVKKSDKLSRLDVKMLN